MSTWRDVIAPRVGQIIANARVRGLDEKALRKALRNPYRKGPSWQRQVWYDEVARQLRKPEGRIWRRGSPEDRHAELVEAGQLSLDASGERV